VKMSREKAYGKEEEKEKGNKRVEHF